MKPLTALSVLSVLMVSSSCAPAPEARQSQAPPPTPAPAKITQFYASPAAIGQGGRSLICYGVEGAAKVRIDPAVEELTPSLARCVEVKPAATTKYTLYVANRAGAETSQELTVTIDPKLRAGEAAAPQGLILFFTAAQTKVPKGAPAMLCYGVKGAASVSVSPAVQTLTPGERMCFQARPEVSTTYVLTATAAGGAKDTETVRITVE